MDSSRSKHIWTPATTGTPRRNYGRKDGERTRASCAMEKEGMGHVQARKHKWECASGMDWRNMRRQSAPPEGTEESSDQGSTSATPARTNVSRKNGCVGYVRHGTRGKEGSTGDTCTSSRETGAQDGAAAGTEHGGRRSTPGMHGSSRTNMDTKCP